MLTCNKCFLNIYVLHIHISDFLDYLIKLNFIRKWGLNNFINLLTPPYQAPQSHPRKLKRPCQLIPTLL